ncbi:MAG: TRAP transporter substrate-binding protein DctP, partial [Armatimonadota bacterium]|nr:TRAP transporter substrate-binding protein DctP [Armatimonadota bacterium]
PGGSDVVVCQLGRLVPGESRSVEIYALIKPDTAAGATLVNEAQVTSDTVDPSPANNTVQAENFVLQKADLAITKFGKPDGQVRAGEILTYTVIVDNLGPSWATGVALKDVLQSSGKWQLLDVTSDRQMSCSSLPAGAPGGIAVVDQRLQIDCRLSGALEALSAESGPPNAGRWILTIRVTAPETQDINNVAQVTNVVRLAGEPRTGNLALDPDPGNNVAYVEHDITDVADLTVTKTALGEVVTGCSANNPVIGNAANRVVAGRQLVYTIVVTNNGPSTADNTLLYDRLPAGVTLIGGTINGSATRFATACRTGTAGDAADQLVCGLGSLPPVGSGRTVTIVLTVRVRSDLAAGTILENDVHVRSEIYDPSTANDFAHNLTTVETSADLRLAKAHDPATATAGQLLRYTLMVTNDGPSVAKNVHVYDDLPAQVTYVGATGGDCIEDPVTPGNVVCRLGDLAPAETRYVYIVVVVHPDAPGTIVNTAVAQSGFSDDTPAPGGVVTPDPCPADNQASDSTTVIRVVDVWYLGTRHFTTNKPFRTPAELARLKIRVPNNPIYIENLRCMGGNPVPMGIGEVYLALKTGVVDGQENPFTNINAFKFYEVAKYLVLTGHQVGPIIPIIHEKTWEALGAEGQRIVVQAFEEGGKVSNALVLKDEAELLGKFKAAGMEVITPDMEAFRAQARRCLPDKFGKVWGQGVYEAIASAR